MMEENLLRYLRSSSSLVAAVGTKENINLGLAPETAKMPWVGVEIPAGTRTKISSTLMEQKNTIRISVYVAPDQKAKGKSIAEIVLRLLENYRGSLYSIQDLYISCGSIGMSMALGGSVRYQFLASLRFVEAITEPTI